MTKKTKGFTPAQEKALVRGAQMIVKTRAGRIFAVVVVAIAFCFSLWESTQLVLQPSEDMPSSETEQVERVVTTEATAAAEQDKQEITAVQKENLNPDTFTKVTVDHVVDGDTLSVTFSDGTRQSVRLIGIDTPESVAPEKERNSVEGETASNRMKELVREGDTVWLQNDTSQADKYDRPLVYVWTELPASEQDALNPETVLRYQLNAQQVYDGFGQAKTYQPDTLHDALFHQWGSEAIDSDRGVTFVWS